MWGGTGHFNWAPWEQEVAPAFLPPTGSCFGRTSKRRSHWLYVVTTAVGTEKFIDSDGDTTFVPVFKLLPATTGPWPAPTTTESGVVCENCPSPPPGRAARTVTTP